MSTKNIFKLGLLVVLSASLVMVSSLSSAADIKTLKPISQSLTSKNTTLATPLKKGVVIGSGKNTGRATLSQKALSPSKKPSFGTNFKQITGVKSGVEVVLSTPITVPRNTRGRGNRAPWPDVTHATLALNRAIKEYDDAGKALYSKERSCYPVNGKLTVQKQRWGYCTEGNTVQQCIGYYMARCTLFEKRTFDEKEANVPAAVRSLKATLNKYTYWR